MRFKPVLCCALALLGGCASVGRGGDIVVDMRGVDPGRYKQDMAECRAYADEAPIAESVAKRAAGGAAVGAVIGAIFGGGRGAAQGAGAGATGAGARGGLEGAERKRHIMQRCMSNRGYNVLG